MMAAFRFISLFFVNCLLNYEIYKWQSTEGIYNFWFNIADDKESENSIN